MLPREVEPRSETSFGKHHGTGLAAHRETPPHVLPECPQRPPREAFVRRESLPRPLGELRDDVRSGLHGVRDFLDSLVDVGGALRWFRCGSGVVREALPFSNRFEVDDRGEQRLGVRAIERWRSEARARGCGGYPGPPWRCFASSWSLPRRLHLRTLARMTSTTRTTLLVRKWHAPQRSSCS